MTTEETTPGVARTDADLEGAVATSGKAPKPARRYGYRHLQASLLFAGFFLAYTMRVNLSVAIVAMMDSAGANPDFPEYDWSEGAKSLVLSSFYWGYVLMQLPAGHFARLFGPKTLLAVSVGGASFFTLLTPLAAAWAGWPLVCAFRMIQGICQGMIVPSMHTHMSRWIPVEERDKLTTFSYAGGLLGNVVALPVCGALSVSSAGWPANFYVFGALGLVWAISWALLGADSPAAHKRISPAERQYIQDSLGGVVNEKALVTPWREMVTSLPLWAIIVGNCGHGWGFATLLTEMPTFMASVLGFNLQANGLLSAVPYLTMFLMSFVFSSLSAMISRKQLMTLTQSRKLFNTIGLWGPMVALVGLSYSKDGTLSVVLLTLTVGVSSATYLGFNVNPIDLAPSFAGTIIGISNGAANIMSIISPIVVGAVVTESGNTVQWRTVFFIAAGIYLVTNSFYLVFASAEPQDWSKPEERGPTTNNRKSKKSLSEKLTTSE